MASAEVLDAWKLLQSNSKASADKKIVWMIFKKDGKKIVIDEVHHASDEEKEKGNGDTDRHQGFTDAIFKRKEPRYGGIDLKGKVFFVSYVDDNESPKLKFPYANGREAFKGSLSGIQLDVQAHSAGELAYEKFIKLVK